MVLHSNDRYYERDLVELGARRLVVGWLVVKPHDVVYGMARSADMWERRTAIVATSWFLRTGDVDDTFAIAELLLGDREDLIHKATGGWLRDAGRSSRPRLLAVLDAHAATMPRTALRYAIEHLDKADRDHYLGLKNA
jgi:3-methyladenine DNA glycosylase AlkD